MNDIDWDKELHTFQQGVEQYRMEKTHKHMKQQQLFAEVIKSMQEMTTVKKEKLHKQRDVADKEMFLIEDGDFIAYGIHVNKVLYTSRAPCVAPSSSPHCIH